MTRPFFLILIPLFPLLGFLLNGFLAFQRARNKGVVSNLWVTVIGCAAPILSLAFTLKAFFVLLSGQTFAPVQLWNWIVVDDVNVSLSLSVDRLSGAILLVLALLGSVTTIFLARKQKTNKNAALHMALLNLFLFIVIVIVMSGLLNLLFALPALTREALWISSLTIILVTLCLFLFKKMRRRRRVKISVETNHLKTCVVRPILWCADVFLNRGVDRVLVDGVMMNGPARCAQVLSSSLSRLQTGSLNFYLLILAGTLLAILAWIIL